MNETAEHDAPVDSRQRHSRRRALIGWGAAAAVVSAGLAVVANLSEIAGWFAPDETLELVEQTRATVADTDAKVNELVTLLRNQAAAAGMDLNLEAEAAMRNAVEAIVVSGNRQKQLALTELEAGNVRAAAEMMTELATTQTSAASATSDAAARSWSEAGALYYGVDIDQSIRSYVEAHRLRPRDPAVLGQLGHALIRAGRVEEARARFDQARLLAPGPEVLAGLELGVGQIEKQSGNYPAAERHYLAALETASAAGRVEDQVNALIALGNLERARGDMSAADAHLRRALTLAERSDNPGREADVLAALGTVAATRREFEEADEFLRAALEIYQQRNDLAGQANVIGDRGALALLRDDLEAAELLLQQSVALAERLGWQSPIAYDLVNLAAISLAGDDFAGADAQLERAQRIAADSGLAELEPVIVHNRGEIAWAAGDAENACRYWGEAAPRLSDMGSAYAEQARQRLAEAACAADSQ